MSWKFQYATLRASNDMKCVIARPLYVLLLLTSPVSVYKV